MENKSTSSATIYFLVLLIFGSLINCSETKPESYTVDEMNIKEHAFGQTPEGQEIKNYTLNDGKGIEAELINFGAILVSLKTPDKNGNSEDITLGYDSLEGYLEDKFYLGATVGRYANRIGKASFTLNGTRYTLAGNNNNGENHLHGGFKGFNKVVWEAEKIEEADSVGIRFTYLSKDGEEGYPGNLSVTTTYILTKYSELKVYFEASTDKTTQVNLTHHSYFNLTSDVSRNVLAHDLTIFADRYTSVDADMITTGEIESVQDTDLDFTNSTAIGARIANIPYGYDFNYVINKMDGELALAAQVYEPESGRVMELFTTEPGLQFYSGNYLDSSVEGKGGKKYAKHDGFCLEPQHFPDSPNKPAFPSTILNPGETYSHVTVFKFSAR